MANLKFPNYRIKKILQNVTIPLSLLTKVISGFVPDFSFSSPGRNLILPPKSVEISQVELCSFF